MEISHLSPESLPKIRALSKDVVHRIAAGEVVERPASALKEMIENSLDAGARKIRVNIADGGFTQIEVEDDGWGLSREDLTEVAERHATSKISLIDDLDQILTLGFRGEALSAIASVSRVEIDSRRQGASDSFKVDIIGGKKSAPEKSSRAIGTRIRVLDLFFNIPARRKFLKKPALEAAECVDTLERVAMTHPEVQFEWFVVNKGEVKSQRLLKATSLEGRFQDLIRIKGEMFKVACSHPSPGVMQLEVLALKPPQVSKFQKSVRLVVNGRVVFDKRLPFALREAFVGLIEPGAFPYALVKVTLDPSMIDVNIHPQKKEIRWPVDFSIGGQVYQVVKTYLDGARVFRNKTDGVLPAKQDSFSFSGDTSEKPSSDFDASLFLSERNSGSSPQIGVCENQGQNNLTSGLNQTSQPRVPTLGNQSVVQSLPVSGNLEAGHMISSGASRAAADLRGSFSSRGPYPPKFVQQNSPDHYSRPPLGASTVADQRANRFGTVVPDSPDSVAYFRFSELRPIGECSASWIVCESPGGLVLIDQHAAHERIQFEKILERKELLRARPLLVPLSVDVPLGVDSRDPALLKLLEESGFELDTDKMPDDTLEFVAVPECDRRINWREFFESVFEKIKADESVQSILDKLKVKLASSLACHGSVRRGQRLGLEQIRELLRQMDEIKWGGLCPHGRPVWFELSHQKLEETFHR